MAVTCNALALELMVGKNMTCPNEIPVFENSMALKRKMAGSRTPAPPVVSRTLATEDVFLSHILFITNGYVQ